MIDQHLEKGGFQSSKGIAPVSTKKAQPSLFYKREALDNEQTRFRLQIKVI